MSKSTTQRALKECKRRQWPAEVVEKFNFYTKRKRDLFGFADLVAITPTGIVAIQVTSGSHHANRIAKARTQPHFAAWLKVAPFLVWSFAKRGKGKAKRWTLREEQVTV